MTTMRAGRRPRAAAPAQVGAAVAVAAIVVAGVWVSGGLITDDFRAAMVLTALWMAAAAVACGLLAWRRRGLRWPVLGAYLITAAVIGLYLARSTLTDDVVNEQVVAADPDGPRPGAAGRDRARNVLLRRGAFEPVAHPATGTASTIRRAGGGEVLTLTDFDVDNGPDLRVYLVSGPAEGGSDVGDHEDLGGLKGNRGNQQYDIPRGIDLDRYTTVVIWCRAFSVNFARAPLR